jgi:hypothetical protein
MKSPVPEEYEGIEDATVESPSSTIKNAVVNSRAERKRDREKKRRSDLNEVFDQLQELIFKVSPEVRADAEERMSGYKASKNEEHSIISRLELVQFAINALESMYEENEERKMVIQHLARGLLAASGVASAPLPPSVNQSTTNLAASPSLPTPSTLRDIPDIQVR